MDDARCPHGAVGVNHETIDRERDDSQNDQAIHSEIAKAGLAQEER